MGMASFHIASGHGTRRRLVMAGLFAASALSTPAWAQAVDPQESAAPIGIADIVVTAQRRAESMQNVPIAVTALNAETLEATGVRDTSDLKAVAPSLNFNTAVGGFGLPRIRGVGSTGTGPGIENPVATYIDGIYIGSATGAMMTLNDIEQVAVLKGPQGTLFGRNATGGLIQITTKKPSYDLTGDFKASYGNYDTIGGSAYLSGGLAGNLAASVAFKYDNRRDGYGVNVNTGNDIMTEKSYAGRAKLLWEIDDASSLTLSADFSRVNAASPAFRPLTRNVRGQFADGGRRDIDSDIDPTLRSRQYGGSVELRHDFGTVDFMSLTGYRKMKLRVSFDPDGTTEGDWAAVPAANAPPLGFSHGFIIDNNQIDTQLTHEVQLLSDNDSRFQWVLGGFYMWGEGRYEPSRNVNAFQTNVQRSYTDLEVKQTLQSMAAFAQGTYRLGEATNVTAGIRYTRDQRRAVGSRITYSATTGQPLPVQTFPQGVIESYRKTFPRATWRLSIDHRFSPEMMAYASYNRGFRSAAFVAQNIGLNTPLENKVLKPEIVDAYEVGLKTDLFDRRLRFNVAGYYYDQKNVQVMQIQNGIQTVYNADGAEIYGVDADFQIRPFGGLTLTGGVNVTHARYKNFDTAVISIPNAAGGNTLTIGDASGKRLQNVPDWTLSLGATYDIPTSIGDFTIGANYYHNDGWAADPDNRVAQGSYDLLDASLSWRAQSGLTLSVWGKNLTNAFYFQQLGASNFSDNGVQAAPRTYGVTAGIRF